MRLVISINMDNAAFEDGNAAQAVVTILKGISRRLSPGGDINELDGVPLFDSNGNSVGGVELVHDTEGVNVSMGHPFEPPPIQGPHTRMHICAKCGEPAAKHRR